MVKSLNPDNDLPTERSQGWYPDPWGLDKQRWYDGATWTRHLWPPDPEIPPAAAANTSPAQDQVATAYRDTAVPVEVVANATHRSARTLTRAIPIAALGLSVQLIGFAMQAPELRASAEVIMNSGETAVPRLPGWMEVASQIGQFAIIATTFMYAVWLYRAAIWSRLAGSEGRLGPGWSLGLWLIPIANLMLGYIATVDVAQSTRAKTLVRYWWAFFVPALLAPVIIILTGYSTEGIRYVIAGVSIVLALIAGILGQRVVSAITDDLASRTQPKN